MWTRSGNLIAVLHQPGSRSFGYAVFSGGRVPGRARGGASCGRAPLAWHGSWLSYTPPEATRC